MVKPLSAILVKEWHPTKNQGLSVSGVAAGTHKKVWWKCVDGHEWEAAVYSRSVGSGCPYCAGQRVCDDNCLATVKPHLVLEWHQTKNRGLTPDDVTPGTYKKVWWQCIKGHEWLGAVQNRSRGSGCPYCAGKKVCLDNCLATINPDLAAEWHPTKNGRLAPSDITPSSNKKAWWICGKGHEWQSTLGHRSAGQRCPFCSGQRACQDNCLTTVSPSLAAEWHPTKNRDLTPNDVTACSHKKIWWFCAKGHEWEAVIKCRSGGSGCPYCSGRRALPETCLTAVNPILAVEWHTTKNGELTPTMVAAHSNKCVWWQCSEKHEWQSTVSNRSKGSSCPYCAGRKALPETCLATLNPTLAKEWHPTRNGALTPEMVTTWSGKKAWWKCSAGHEWPAQIGSRSRGNGCARCSTGPVSVASQKWLDLIGIPVEFREYSIKLPGKKRPSRVDGFDPATNTIYEFLGDFWHGNPERFDPEERNPINNWKFKTLYAQTMKRIKTLEKAGYNVVFTWEKDYA